LERACTIPLFKKQTIGNESEKTSRSSLFLDPLSLCGVIGLTGEGMSRVK
jgi:hypothetical protein